MSSPSPITPEIQAKISLWRQKCQDGSITLDEMKEAILIMRAGRKSAATASDGARRKQAKAAIPNADDMLSELDNI